MGCADSHNIDLRDALASLFFENRRIFKELLSLNRPKSRASTLKLRSTLTDAEAFDDEQGEDTTLKELFPRGVGAFVTATRNADANPHPHHQTLHFSSLDIDEVDDDDDGQDYSNESLLYRRGRYRQNTPTKEEAVKYASIHYHGKSNRLNDPFVFERPEKIMSHVQLREVMTECLTTKSEKDDQCRNDNKPLETLESHLYDFLESFHKSGDTDEIKDWFLAMSKAIRNDASFDWEISVFGKMLQNNLPESFITNQRVLRENAEKMLRKIVVSDEWASRMYEGISVDKYEEVIRHLFNQKDANEIMRRIKDPVRKTAKQRLLVVQSLSRGKVKYQHAMEVLMTFNMNLQDDFLVDFNQIFRKVDTSRDGYINNSQIMDLVRRVATIPGVREGTDAYSLLLDAKAATLRSVKRLRRATYSELVEKFTDLLGARWSLGVKKNGRYNYHDKLKTTMMDKNRGERMEKETATPREQMEKDARDEAKKNSPREGGFTVEDTPMMNLTRSNKGNPMIPVASRKN